MRVTQNIAQIGVVGGQGWSLGAWCLLTAQGEEAVGESGGVGPD